MKETSALVSYLQEEAASYRKKLQAKHLLCVSTKDCREHLPLEQAKRIASHKSVTAEVEHSAYNQNFFCLSNNVPLSFRENQLVTSTMVPF